MRGRDIKRYKAEFADLWLINTHNGYTTSKGEKIPPIDVNNYPAIKEHLDKYWNKLKKRYDKGITPYNLRNCAYLEEFEKEKIVWGSVSETYYCFVEKDIFLLDTNYFAVFKKKEINKYILALLNSKLIINYINDKDTLVGTVAYRHYKYNFENIPIPKILNSQQKPFEIIVDYILFLKPQKQDNKSLYFEQIIDGMVYELYFEEEIKKANCEIIKYLNDLPEITDDMTDNEKQKVIDSVFEKFFNNNHPVKKNLSFMDNIDEVKIIKKAIGNK